MARAESDAECRGAADDFVRFVEGEGSTHFREEEEIIFPLLAAYLDQPSELIDRALVEHGRLRAAAVRFGQCPEQVATDVVASVAWLLEAHIRREEREIFPLVERVVPDDVLAAVGLATRVPPSGPVEVGSLADPAGAGSPWAVASADLNATVVAWQPGGGVSSHRNDERDVLVVVIAGDGTLRVDGRQIHLHAQRGVMIPKGTVREVSAGPDGLRYLSIHLRRSGLTQIRPRS
jgi:quercetin dioxygenase-like cupin family protein